MPGNNAEQGRQAEGGEPARAAAIPNQANPAVVANGTPYEITHLIRPITYAIVERDGVRESLTVNFAARRLDGREVMVDNHYLRQHHPLLLIDFYEMHIRHSETHSRMLRQGWD